MTQGEILDLLKKYPHLWFSSKELSIMICHGGSMSLSLKSLRKSNFMYYRMSSDRKNHITYEYRYKKNE